MMMFFVTSHKTDHLGNAVTKYLPAVQPTGRTSGAEFRAEEENNKTKFYLPLFVCKAPIHVEGSTQKVLPC